MKALEATSMRRTLAVIASVLVGAIPMLVAAPASAAGTCAAGTGAGNAVATVTTDATVQMVSGVLNFGGANCPAGTDSVAVTGAGVMTFNLSGGEFETASGDPIEFELDLTSGSVVVNGTPGPDRITMGTRGINLDAESTVEITEPANDITQSGVTAWTINGLDGNDLISGGGELSGQDFPMAVTMNGGDGVAANDASDDDGVDNMTGGTAADTLNGEAGSDTLDGAAGTDTMTGSIGNDTLTTGNAPDGADVMNGGDGRDRADYSRRTAAVTVTNAAAAGTGNDGDTATSEADDVFAVESVLGGDGNDSLSAATNTTRVTLLGGDGNDTLTGGTAGDALQGNDGDDILNGENGNDRLLGGDDNDTENGGAGNDNFNQFEADNGNDILNGGESANDTDTVTYAGRREAVTVTVGTGGANDGASGETDTIADDIEKVVGGRERDTMTAHSSGSTLLGGGDEDTLNGADGNDTLKGGSDDDTLNGNGGNDTLAGGSGDDDLDGGPGTDTTNGGTGNDSCTGGETRRSC